MLYLQGAILDLHPYLNEAYFCAAIIGKRLRIRTVPVDAILFLAISIHNIHGRYQRLSMVATLIIIPYNFVIVRYQKKGSHLHHLLLYA